MFFHCLVLGQQDWMKQLNQSGQFTVFAPSDEAFAKMDAEARDRLLKGQGCINSERLIRCVHWIVQ